MTIDGFLQFLGLAVAIFALISAVSRYRLRLQGPWLWVPTVLAFVAVVYLLLFDLVALPCRYTICSRITLHSDQRFTPNKIAFIVVLVWLVYAGLLSRRTSVGRRQLPLLASLVDRLAAERRYSELVDFIQPHVRMIARCASRSFPLQKLVDKARWHGSPFLSFDVNVSVQSRYEKVKTSIAGRSLSLLKPIVNKLPVTGKKEDAALKILRVLHTHDELVEFVALERPLFALKLMKTRVHDHDFSDRVFEIMMAQPRSQLRRETMLNLSTRGYFYEIDPKNPLIYALFANARDAESLQVWRPVGNYPLSLLEHNTGDYRRTISAKKPWEEEILHKDPTYVMIWFFDLMVRSAIRDNIEWHMWLYYFDILVDKILSYIDFRHPEYDESAEFPNFGYYLIYEIFDKYGEWMRSVEHCSKDSPVVMFNSTAAGHDNGSILKSTLLSMGQSLKHLIDSQQTGDKFISYIIEVIMRDYKNLARVPGAPRLQEAFRNSILAGGNLGGTVAYGARLKRCYDKIDHCLKYDTRDFEEALLAAYP